MSASCFMCKSERIESTLLSDVRREDRCIDCGFATRSCLCPNLTSASDEHLQACMDEKDRDMALSARAHPVLAAMYPETVARGQRLLARTP